MTRGLPIVLHRRRLLACRRCTGVHPPVVTGRAVESPIYFLGQAPGVHEGDLGQPFAWTAGKRLFAWLGSLGVAEEEFRSRVYMAAVIRCFPGKAKQGGGDRVPHRTEISACGSWIADEVRILRPRLVVAVGRLAMERVSGTKLAKLHDVVGPVHRNRFEGHDVDWVGLPHPSGLSAWHKVEPGKRLLRVALSSLAAHEAWKQTFPLARAGE